MSSQIVSLNEWENQSVYLFAAADADDDFSGNVSIAQYHSEQKITLEMLVQQSPLPEGLDSLLVMQKGYLSIGKTQYYQRVYSFIEPTQSKVIVQAQRFVLVDKKPFIITYTHAQEAFEKNKLAFEEMFRSLIVG